MKDLLNKLAKIEQECDAAIINRFCKKGTFIDVGSGIVCGVCRPVHVNEFLNLIHCYNGEKAELLSKELDNI